MDGTLESIHIYPVKSCRAVALDEVEITRTGLRGDRLFQVIDSDGNPVTQRQQPVLATVVPSLIDRGLRLEADGRSPLEVEAPTVNDTTAKSLLGVSVEAGDAGEEAAAWFSEVVGRPVRLVAMTDRSECHLPVPGVDMPLSWADGSSVLVVNNASLQWLKRQASDEFGMDRFRPNLTVDGEAWAEDSWRDFTIGAARFGLGFPWPRCAIPQIDQIDGSRHMEPAKVLRSHRWCSEASSADEVLRPFFEGNSLFGIGCSVRTEAAMLVVGDAVQVHETGPRIIPAPV